MRSTDQDKALLANTPGVQEADSDMQQLTPTPENNTEGVVKQSLMQK